MTDTRWAVPATRGGFTENDTTLEDADVEGFPAVAIERHLLFTDLSVARPSKRPGAAWPRRLVFGIEQHQPYADLSVQRLTRPIPMTLFGDVS